MENFSKIIGGDKPVLVDFYATWCGPCRTMHTILYELRSAIGDKADVVMLDIDDPDNKKQVELYNIRSVPTMIIFRRGEALWRRSGVVTSIKLQALLLEFAGETIPEPSV